MMAKFITIDNMTFDATKVSVVFQHKNETGNQPGCTVVIDGHPYIFDQWADHVLNEIKNGAL